MESKMFDMRFETARQRCLVFALKGLLKSSRGDISKRLQQSYEDEYWKITIEDKSISAVKDYK